MSLSDFDIQHSGNEKTALDFRVAFVDVLCGRQIVQVEGMGDLAVERAERTLQ